VFRIGKGRAVARLQVVCAAVHSVAHSPSVLSSAGGKALPIHPLPIRNLVEATGSYGGYGSGSGPVPSYGSPLPSPAPRPKAKGGARAPPLPPAAPAYNTTCHGAGWYIKVGFCRGATMR
jgi:hypothetical protein